MEESPNACVEFIELVHEAGVLEAQIAEPLTYVKRLDKGWGARVE